MICVTPLSALPSLSGCHKMGTKDRTLRRMPSRGSQTAAIRQNKILTVSKDGMLGGILTQLQMLVLADANEPEYRGHPVSRHSPIRLVKFLDEYGYSISTNESSPTVDAAANALSLSPGRVVELMHQVKKLASGRDLPTHIRCRLTHRETVGLVKQLGIRLSSSQARHHRIAASRPLVRMGRPRLSPDERQYRARTRRTLVGHGQPRGLERYLTALEIVILLSVTGQSPFGDGSALPGARLKLRRARNFLGRFYRRSGSGRLASSRWSN
jgi:hypothetical protein